MHDKKYYKLGELVFSISGDGEAFDYLNEEFGCLPEPADSPSADVDFVLSHCLPAPPPGAVYTKTHSGWNVGFQYTSDYLKYQVTRTGGRYTVVLDVGQISTPGPYTLAQTFLDLNYLTPGQQLAKNFMYNCFNLITGLILSERGAGCYLHASSVEKKGKAVALIANGGIGKTASMLHLVSRKGWRYLSDDIALLDRDGNLIRTPLRMQVYAYNLPGNDGLKHDLMRGRSLLDRAAWLTRLFVKGPHRTRRRVSANELFGEERTASTAKCHGLFFLERAFIDEARIEACDSSYILKKLLSLMPREIGGLSDLSDSLDLVECGLNELSSSTFSTSTKQFFESSARTIPKYKISVPFDMPSGELVTYMENVLNKVVFEDPE